MRYNSTVIAVVTAVTIAVGVMAFMYSRGWRPSCNSTSKYKDKVTTEEVIEESSEEVAEISSLYPVLDDYVEMSMSAKSMSVEKVIRTTKELDDGNNEVTYEAYILSEINLIEHTEYTTDYSAASVGNDFDMNKGVDISFEEAFGFDYKELDGGKIYEQLLNEEGIDSSLENVAFDTQTYELTEQNVYVLKGNCSVTQMLLLDTQYDELISSSVSYQTVENEDGKTVPDFFSAVVQYRAGNEIVTKNLFLQITVNY